MWNQNEIEEIKTIFERLAPCTLLDLVQCLKEKYDKVSGIVILQQLRNLVKQKILDSSKIKKVELLRGLTIEEKRAIKEIVEETIQEDKRLSFNELAIEVEVRTKQSSVQVLEQKIRFLFIPLSSKGHYDEDDYTS